MLKLHQIIKYGRENENSVIFNFYIVCFSLVIETSLASVLSSSVRLYNPCVYVQNNFSLFTRDSEENIYSFFICAFLCVRAPAYLMSL